MIADLFAFVLYLDGTAHEGGDAAGGESDPRPVQNVHVGRFYEFRDDVVL